MLCPVNSSLKDLEFSYKRHSQPDLASRLYKTQDQIHETNKPTPLLSNKPPTMQLNHSIHLISNLLLLLLSTLISAIPHNITSTPDSPSDLLLSRQANAQSLTSDAEFRRTMLAGHNFYRFQHGAGSVVWNDQRAQASTQHSRTCVWTHSGARGVSENSTYQ